MLEPAYTYSDEVTDTLRIISDAVKTAIYPFNPVNVSTSVTNDLSHFETGDMQIDVFVKTLPADVFSVVVPRKTVLEFHFAQQIAYYLEDKIIAFYRSLPRTQPEPNIILGDD